MGSGRLGLDVQTGARDGTVQATVPWRGRQTAMPAIGLSDEVHTSTSLRPMNLSHQGGDSITDGKRLQASPRQAPVMQSAGYSAPAFGTDASSTALFGGHQGGQQEAVYAV